MTDINQPVEVSTPEPITVLESAMNALTHDSSKTVHLSPGQALALLVEDERKEEVIIELVHEIERLEGENIRLRDEAAMWKHKHGYVTTEMPVDKQSNVIQQALDSLSPEMRASHFTTLRKIQDEQEAARDERKR